MKDASIYAVALLYIRFEAAGGVCRWRRPNTGQVNKERSEEKPPIGHCIACRFDEIASLSLQLQIPIYLLRPLCLTCQIVLSFFRYQQLIGENYSHTRKSRPR